MTKNTDDHKSKVQVTFDPALWILEVARHYLSEDYARQLANEVAGNPRMEIKSLGDRTVRTVATKPTTGKGRVARVWSDSERRAAGERLMKRRAEKFGLTVDELRTMRLRPGREPTEEQMAAVMEARGEQPTTNPPKKTLSNR